MIIIIKINMMMIIMIMQRIEEKTSVYIILKTQITQQYNTTVTTKNDESNQINEKELTLVDTATRQ